MSEFPVSTGILLHQILNYGLFYHQQRIREVYINGRGSGEYYLIETNEFIPEKWYI